MTLKSLFTARCTSTRFPLGAPAMSSIAHWPVTMVQPSIPLASKSQRSAASPSGTRSSSAAAAEAPRVTTEVANEASPTSAVVSARRRDTFCPSLVIGSSKSVTLPFDRDHLERHTLFLKSGIELTHPTQIMLGLGGPYH